MSRFASTEITCTCGSQLVVRVVQDLHASARPRDRAQILAGTYQEHRCTCGTFTIVESRFLYTDFARGHYVIVEPPGTDLWSDLAMHRRVYTACFDGGSPIARDLGRGLVRRIVAGLDGLREKLRLWDAGLDDYVIEAIKLDVLARCDQIGLGVRSVHLVDILPGHHVVLGLYRGKRPSMPPRPAQDAPDRLATITVPRVTYEARAKRRDAIAHRYPELAHEWIVDALDTIGA